MEEKIKPRSFSAEEELYLRRTLEGINYLRMVEILNALSTMDTKNLNDLLKEEIEGLQKSIQEESMSLRAIEKRYERLLQEVANYRYVMKKRREEDQRNCLVEKITRILFDKLNNYAIQLMDQGNLKKLKEVYRVHSEVLETLDKVQSEKKISNEALALLEPINYSNTLEDKMLINQVKENKTYLKSKVYLKRTHKENDNCDFSVLLEENDGTHYMVSFNDDGTVAKKDPVMMMGYNNNDLRIASKDSNGYSGFYVPIDEELNDFDCLNRNRFFYLNPDYIRKIKGSNKDEIVLMTSSMHYLSLTNGVLKVKEITPGTFFEYLSQEEAKSYEVYQNLNFVVHEIEKQMAHYLTIHFQKTLQLKNTKR